MTNNTTTNKHAVPNAKEQVKIYNENTRIERPSQTLKILNEKNALSKENCDVILSFLLQRLVGADPDIKFSSSDLRLQVGEHPTYFIKSEGGWFRDERVPKITETMMENFFDYAIPETNKTNIVKLKSKGIKSIDEDFSIDLNINTNFNYDGEYKKEDEKDYMSIYATKPQYLIQNSGNPLITLSRFRGNLTLSRGKKLIILRKIDAEIPDFYDLNLNPRFLELLEYDRGLILVTGPTGSGKTTTLASLVNEINKTQTKHIVTLENPIEFVHDNKQSFFTQRDIPGDSESFASGMRSALRQKPDIILFGEMRDAETIAGGIEAAETGHLVFGTLHTFNAAKTVDRLINTFPDEVQNQIASSLSGAFVASISQTLVKTKDGGITALNELIRGTGPVKKSISEINSQRIVADAKNNPDEHLTMVNHAFELIKSDIVDQVEIFKKIYIEDFSTYKELVDKLKSVNMYEAVRDPYTEENLQKSKMALKKKIEEKMGITDKKTTTTNLSESAKIENELNNKDKENINDNELMQGKENGYDIDNNTDNDDSQDGNTKNTDFRSKLFFNK